MTGTHATNGPGFDVDEEVVPLDGATSNQLIQILDKWNTLLESAQRADNRTPPCPQPALWRLDRRDIETPKLGHSGKPAIAAHHRSRTNVTKVDVLGPAIGAGLYTQRPKSASPGIQLHDFAPKPRRCLPRPGRAQVDSRPRCCRDVRQGTYPRLPRYPLILPSQDEES